MAESQELSGVKTRCTNDHNNFWLLLPNLLGPEKYLNSEGIKEIVPY